MNRFEISQTVGDIVTREPGLSRVFESLGIDYCCGGKMALGDACQRRSLDPQVVLSKLEDESNRSAAMPPPFDPAAMSLTTLADHIERTHHVFVKTEIPRLREMAAKVASVHGDRDARLATVRDTFDGLAAEMTSHMMKEERILFPLIRQLEGGAGGDGSCGHSISAPIRQMESEHEQAGEALSALNGLTGGYTPPEWACNTYRAFLDGLQHFERDLHEHIHKENNVLFPRALSREALRN
ncbi:MAG: iron-sulfur cluster repair di-iron protein [candidate division Zixibacteria bacterium]|nr:iron-sulfur cluster repair di-iron protein [candidate division Zixibacteria bacterium]